MNNPCNECTASKIIKDTLSCNADRIRNNFEVLKCAIGVAHKPQYQCRLSNLVLEEGAGNNE